MRPPPPPPILPGCPAACCSRCPAVPQVAATLLAVSYAFVMGMIIVNMLVGLMANALEKVR